MIRNLEIEGFVGGVLRAGDGVKASDVSHHVTLENLTIRNCSADQQIVGINTKAIAWNWVIRRNVIETCGTGIYLGNSDGEDEFVNGLIEENLVRDTIGYGMQIKFQNGRDTSLPGMPTTATTIIRHNVFHKSANSSTGGAARPNLLVGHGPLTGVGSDDDVLIYGNLLHHNPSGESLLQATGNVLVYSNLFVADTGPGVRFQFHDGGGPQRIRFVQNTVLSPSTGVSVSGEDPSFEQLVVGNAIFAATQVSGGDASQNVLGLRNAAPDFLAEPDGTLGVDLDLFPVADSGLQGAVDPTALGAAEDAGRDFDGRPRTLDFRGAYAGEGTHVGWPLALERKTVFGAPLFADGFESGDTTAWSS